MIGENADIRKEEWIIQLNERRLEMKIKAHTYAYNIFTIRYVQQF